MIQGKTIRTEKEYRQLPRDSSSSIKDFSVDRRKYYKKFISGEKVEEEDSKASVIGRVVETLLLEPHEFDNRFYMSSISSAPTGNMLTFCESLYKHTQACMSEEDSITREFKDIALDAYKDSGYKITFERVIDNFQGKNPEIYYKELLNVKSKGLTVVTVEDITNSERIVEELKTNEFIGPIINLENSERYSVYNQLQIDGFEIDGLQLKAMLDKVIVDHKKREITPYDLKITWAVENFVDDYLLYRRGYFQYYLYYYAIKHWAEEMGLDNYAVNYLKFIVGDSINYYKPLIYQVNSSDMLKAYVGFEKSNKFYPGVESTIKDLIWAKENNIWNISRNNYLNEGIVSLNL